MLPNTGNAEEYSVMFFINNFKKFVHNESSLILNMLENTLKELKKSKSTYRWMISDITTSENLNRFQYGLKIFLNEENIGRLNYFDYNSLQNDPDDLVKIRLIVEIMQSIPINIIRKKIVIRDIPCIITSGFVDVNNKHMITFFYNKFEDSTFELYMVNTGAGVEYHQSEGFKKQCILRFIVDELQIKKLKICCFLLRYKIYANAKILYNLLEKFVGISIMNPKRDELCMETNIDYILPQLSGSCTYFSLLYLFQVLFYKIEKHDFNKFNQFIRNKSAKNLIKFIYAQYINKNIYLPPNMKSFIDCLPNEYKNEYTSYITQYYKNNINSYEMNMNVNKDFNIAVYTNNTIIFKKNKERILNTKEFENVWDLLDNINELIKQVIINEYSLLILLIYIINIFVEYRRKKIVNFYEYDINKMEKFYTFCQFIYEYENKYKYFNTFKVIKAQLVLLLLLLNESGQFIINYGNKYHDYYKIIYCGYYTTNVNTKAINEQDIDILVTYAKLISEYISEDMFTQQVKIYSIVKYLNIKTDIHLITFLLKCAIHSTCDQYIGNSFNFKENLLFATNPTKRIDTFTLYNDNIENLINVIKGEKYLKLNKVINNQVKFNDTYLSNEYIYGKDKMSKRIRPKEFVNNVFESIDINKCKHILKNISIYKNSVIFLVCGLLIKNNIIFIRKYAEKLQVIRNIKCNENEKKIFNLILGCINNEYVPLDNYIPRSLSDTYILEYFLTLYINTLSSNPILSTIFNASIFNTHDTLNKVKKMYSNGTISKIDDKIYVHDLTIINDCLFDLGLDNDVATYIKNNYIIIENNNQSVFKYNLINTRKNRTIFYINNLNEFVFIYDNIIYTLSSDIKTYINSDSFSNIIIKNILIHISENILYFYNVNNNKIILYFGNIYCNNKELIIIIDKNNIFVDFNGEIYNICASNNSMISKWLYLIPFCINIEKNGIHRMLLIESQKDYIHHLDYISESLFCNKKIVILEKSDYNSCYINNYDMFGLSIKFYNEHSLKLYAFLCMLYGKSECLKVFYPELLKLNIKGDSYIDKILTILINEGCNSIFNSYFTYFLENSSKKKYNTIIDANIYNYKYYESFNLFEKVNTSPIKINNLFKNIKHLNEAYSHINKIVIKRYDQHIEEYNDDIYKNIINKTTIIDYIKKYLVNYNKCENDIIDNNILESIDINELNIDLKDTIFDSYVDNNEDIVKTILKTPEIFYDIIDAKACLNFINNINIESCNKTRKIFDFIDEKILFMDNVRPIEVVLFEVIFGSPIRNDQYIFYNNVYNEMIAQKEYIVNQMLMGKGKTSVISPLLVIKCAYNNFDNVVMMLPNHLIEQTTNEITVYNKIMNHMQIKLNLNTALPSDHLKCILIINPNPVKELILDQKNIFGNNALIIDEFDSLYDPLSCEFNIPLETEFIRNSNPFNKKQSDNNVLDNYIECIFKFCKLYPINKYKENIHIFVKTIDMPSKLKDLLVFCIMNEYNKDYGFPKKDTHFLPYYAVPYSAVNKPVEKSFFSDLGINITFTILSYIHRNTIKLHDIKFIMKHIRRFNEFEAFLTTDELFASIEQNYGLFIKKKYYTLILNNAPNVAEYIFDDYNKMKNNNMDEIKYYVQKVIIPSIKYTKTQKNCSFIDIINKYIFKQKIGFSGTTNIELPYWEDNNMEFVTSLPNESDVGSTYFSLLGIDNLSPKQIHCISKGPIIDNIIKIINKYNYNSLIDCGAILKEYANGIALSEFIKKIKKRYIIYITSKNIKMVYNTYTHSNYTYNNETYNTEELFIYYDNQHIVGIDIKQPFILNGLVTIDSFNNFSAVAQGMYRLRNLNYGHTIDIMISNNLKNVLINKYNIINRICILDYLLENDALYKTVFARKKLLVQNAKYLNRVNQKFNIDSYTDTKNENINYFQSDNTMEILTTCLDMDIEPNKTIFENYLKINSLNFNKELVQEEEQQQEQEQELQQAQELQQENIYKPIRKDLYFLYIHILINQKEYSVLNKSPEMTCLNAQKIYFYGDDATDLGSIFNRDCNKDYLQNAIGGFLYFINEDIFIILQRNQVTYHEQIQSIKYDPNIIVERNINNIIHSNVPKNRFLFVKILIGKTLLFEEMLSILEYCFSQNRENMNNILNNYDMLFGYQHCNLDGINNFYTNSFIKKMFTSYNTFEELITKLQQLPYSEIYKMITGLNILDSNIEYIIKNTLQKFNY